MICDEHVQYIYVHVHPQVSTNTSMYTYCTWNVVFSSLCTCMVIVYISYVMHAVIVELLNEKVDYKSIGVPRNMRWSRFRLEAYIRGVPRAQQWRQHLKKIIIKWLQFFSLPFYANHSTNSLTMVTKRLRNERVVSTCFFFRKWIVNRLN